MNFEKAVEIILSLEGGYSNHTLDPGGETKFGISKRRYPDENIATLTRCRAIELYKRDFWDLGRCEDVPKLVRLVYFDGCVNHGVDDAIRMLQRVLGVAVDGDFGPITKQAAWDAHDVDTLKNFSLARTKLYFDLPIFSAFGEGWISRLIKIMSYTVGGSLG